MNNGKERQTMTMCMQRCYHDYEQQKKRYDLLGSGSRKPTGVIAIQARARVEDLIMSTLEKMHATADANDHDNDNKGGDLFYAAVETIYESPVAREYFHNDRSRTRPDNKRLWPLRYQAFGEFGI